MSKLALCYSTSTESTFFSWQECPSLISGRPILYVTPHSFQVLSLAIKRYRWQLGQVPKDISRLQSLKEKHMDDPFEFLRQVKSKVRFDVSLEVCKMI